MSEWSTVALKLPPSSSSSILQSEEAAPAPASGAVVRRRGRPPKRGRRGGARTGAGRPRTKRPRAETDSDSDDTDQDEDEVVGAQVEESKSVSPRAAPVVADPSKRRPGRPRKGFGKGSGGFRAGSTKKRKVADPGRTESFETDDDEEEGGADDDDDDDNDDDDGGGGQGEEEGVGNGHKSSSDVDARRAVIPISDLYFDPAETCPAEGCDRPFCRVDNLVYHFTYDHRRQEIDSDFADVIAASAPVDGGRSYFRCSLCGLKMAFRSSVTLHMGALHRGAHKYLPQPLVQKILGLREATTFVKPPRHRKYKPHFPRPPPKPPTQGTRGSSRIRGIEPGSALPGADNTPEGPSALQCPREECSQEFKTHRLLIRHLFDDHLREKVEEDLAAELDACKVPNPRDVGYPYECTDGECGAPIEGRGDMLRHLAFVHDGFKPYISDDLKELFAAARMTKKNKLQVLKDKYAMRSVVRCELCADRPGGRRDKMKIFEFKRHLILAHFVEQVTKLTPGAAVDGDEEADDVCRLCGHCHVRFAQTNKVDLGQAGAFHHGIFHDGIIRALEEAMAAGDTDAEVAFRQLDGLAFRTRDRESFVECPLEECGESMDLGALGQHLSVAHRRVEVMEAMGIASEVDLPAVCPVDSGGCGSKFQHGLMTLAHFGVEHGGLLGVVSDDLRDKLSKLGVELKERRVVVKTEVSEFEEGAKLEAEGEGEDDEDPLEHGGGGGERRRVRAEAASTSALKKGYKCPECPMVRATFRACLTHMSTKHYSKLIARDFAEEVAPKKVREGGGDWKEVYRCPRCRKTMPDGTRLVLHLGSMHEEALNYGEPKSVTPAEQEKIKKRRKANSSRPVRRGYVYHCPECPETRKSRSELLSHGVTVHFREDVERDFADAIARAKKPVGMQEIYKCVLCKTKARKGLSAYVWHLGVSHRGVERHWRREPFVSMEEVDHEALGLLPCSRCNRMYPRKALLLDHMAGYHYLEAMAAAWGGADNDCCPFCSKSVALMELPHFWKGDSGKRARMMNRAKHVGIVHGRLWEVMTAEDRGHLAAVGCPVPDRELERQMQKDFDKDDDVDDLDLDVYAGGLGDATE